MNSDCPPAGHPFVYRVVEDLDSGNGISYEISLPSSMSDLDIATVRVGRRGGDTEPDRVFRRELFEVVGSIAVAAGHVEAAMKRLLLVLTGERTVFAFVDFQWSDLHKRLMDECGSHRADERRQRLSELLTRAESERLAERRHTAVHGAWWVFAGCGARVSRWPRRASDAIIVGQLADWQQFAEKLWEYAASLDELLGDDEWARAMLPADVLA
jgi:hypothetical protein